MVSAERVSRFDQLSHPPARLVTIITAKLSELEQLCEKYPQKIPIEECAAFLGMAGESLRACLEHGSCPFGLGWLKKNAHNRAFYIPTLTFYLWVTQAAGFKEPT